MDRSSLQLPLRFAYETPVVRVEGDGVVVGVGEDGVGSDAGPEAREEALGAGAGDDLVVCGGDDAGGGSDVRGVAV